MESHERSQIDFANHFAECRGGAQEISPVAPRSGEWVWRDNQQKITTARELQQMVKNSQTHFKEGRLAALRGVREMVSARKYGYGCSYNEGHDAAIDGVVDAIDTMILKEEGK
jgi:hypothetical protein